MSDKLSTEELHKLRVDCYADPVLYARVFKREQFEYPMSWVHRGILALLQGKADFLLNFGEEQWPKSSWTWNQEQLRKIIKYFVYKEDPESTTEEAKPLFIWDEEAERIHLVTSRFIALMLPRGVGKTTIVNLSNEIDIVYRDVNFLIYLSETATHAEMQLENVKRELEINSQIQAVFGILKGDRSTGLSWTGDYIETTNGVTAACRGRGGQVRGLLAQGRRPDKIIVDDVEDKESVNTEEQLVKAKRWFHADVVPALPQMSGNGRIVVLGTLLHPQALLMELTKLPDWVSVKFGGLDPEGQPIAPFYMSIEQYEAKRLAFARVGMLMEFEMEYGSRLYSDDDTRKFDTSKIGLQVMKKTEFIAISEVIDPAISENSSAAYTAIGIVGMTDRGHLHVLDLWMKIGAHPREQVDVYFDKHFEWEPTVHGVEAIAYQAALVHLLQEEMFRKAKVFGTRAYFEIVKATKQLHGTEKKKINRIEGILAPRYKANYITHQRYFPELITQLNDWPLGKMDGPDVVAMCIALLDPFAAFASVEESDLQAHETEENVQPLFSQDTYEPIDEALPDWRTAP